jgi:hypothetical protein
MKDKKLINKCKWEIKARITEAGYSMAEAVELMSTDYGWSDSPSNFSNKLAKGSLRYREVCQLAEAMGYDLIWVKGRDKD